MRSWLALTLCCALAGCAPEMANTPVPNNGSPNNGSPNNGSPNSPSPARETLHATALAGPFRALDAACAEALRAAGLPKPAAPCRETPIQLGAGAPFQAVLLRAESAGDPRYVGSGAFFLAIGQVDAWYVGDKPLDQLNGAAGHIYLPVITPEGARLDGGHVLVRMRDATSSVCTSCEGPAHDVKAPVSTLTLAVVCGKDRAGKPACTRPVGAKEGEQVSLIDGLLTIAGATAPKVYSVVF